MERVCYSENCPNDYFRECTLCTICRSMETKGKFFGGQRVNMFLTFPRDPHTFSGAWALRAYISLQSPYLTRYLDL